MASFTDEIVGFNPYIPQIPVDDYVRVGLMKQASYDQGVKKVQGYIDSVAGMDVVKSEHKDYLQQRLGQVQGEVSRIVSQDFSNQQLVNSVGSLTSKVAGDPIIQNAVASTRAYRMENARMKESQQKGSSSPSNEYVYQRDVSNWLSDGDINSSFNAKYTPFTNVSKKVLEAFDKVLEKVPNSHIEDIPFKRGDRGEILRDDTGHPIIDMAMMERSYKGVTPERVQAIIESTLDENDKRQLGIDGMYEYRGLDKGGMKILTDRSYQHNLGMINDTIKGLLIDRQTNITDIQHVAEVDARIDALKNKATQYQDRYKTDISNIDNNLEGYKSSMYAQGWVDRFSNGLAYTQESLTYKENPYFMAAERRRENDIKYQEFLVNKQFQAAELGLKEKELQYKIEDMQMRREMMMLRLKQLKGTGDGTLPLVDPILEPIDEDDISAIDTDSFLNETKDIGDNIESQKMSLLAQVRPDLINVARDPSGKSAHYEYNVAGKNPDSVKSEAEASLLKLKDSYDKNPNSVDDAAKVYFRNNANGDQAIQNRKYAINNLDNEAKKTWDIEPLLAKVPPLRVNTPQGPVTVSAREQMEFNDKYKSLISAGAGGFSSVDYDAARKLFTTPAQKALFAAQDEAKNSMRGASGENARIVSALDNVFKNVNMAGKGIIEGKNQYMDNAVKEIVSVQQPVTFTIESFKSDERNRAQAVAVNIVNSIEKADKGNTNPLYNKNQIRFMLGKFNESTSYSLVSRGRGKNALRISNTRVTAKPVEIDITQQQAEQLFGQGRFLDDFYNIRSSLDLTKGTGKVTTDVQGKGRESAFVLDNGKLNRYGVKYHVEEPLKDGGLQVRLYIYDNQASKDPQTGKIIGQWLPEMPASFGQLLNEAQITKFLSQMDDQYINAVLQQNNKPTNK